MHRLALSAAAIPSALLGHWRRRTPYEEVPATFKPEGAPVAPSSYAFRKSCEKEIRG